MSGIAAIIEFTGGRQVEERVRQMAGRMAYRAPDGTRVWASQGVGIAHCAMHTMVGCGVAPQPWTNEDDSLVVAFDGYLSNDDQLFKTLVAKGYRPRNVSDAELVLRSFEAWGEDCCAHMDGEFAFIIWDARSKTLHAARDHQGLRPLFYHRSDNRLIIASDFAAFDALEDVTLEPDESVMVQLMANAAAWHDETVWKNVRRIMPAHMVYFDQASTRSKRYWDLPAPYSIRYSKDSEYAEHYREILFENVRKAARSDQRLAFEVSGGLDSSGVFAVADALQREGKLPASEIQGYTLAGPPGSDADEVRYSNAVANHLQRKLKPNQLFRPDLEWFISHAQRNSDILYYPNSAMTCGMYRSMSDDGCRIAISGLGGDEWLNGRKTLLMESLSHWDWSMLARSMRALNTDFGPLNAARALWRFGVRPLLGKAMRQSAQSAPQTDIPWLSKEARDILRRAQEARAQAFTDRDDPQGRRRLHTQPMTGLILEHAARLQAQHGIEGRNPLFSRAMIEFSAATPEAIWLRGSQQKFIHRMAINDLLPAEVVERTSKAEFSTVLDGKPDQMKMMVQSNRSDQFNRLLNAKDGQLDSFFEQGKHRDIDGQFGWQLFGLASSALILK
ncbi:asparagine synthase-related protein [Erythrobacter sp. F6033]|uniref:asparagine synthetase B family protein n=1 Tax=Erythrobacter sp. F6033 TaxID=2926401 RepID=UPI001FF42FF9|nr:asparagine synthase-related protein [Erythrobacter sp. F6033]MCK0127992.1 asparagine synthase-related protein [Erythrobacter sp. F6033]